MKSIKAVLFDMDGLMVDNELLHLQAFNNVFRKYNKYLSEDENNKWYIGVSDEDAAIDMVERFHLPLSAKELALAKRESYKQLQKGQMFPLSGLIELLKNLHRYGYKTAIASGSTVEEIKKVIEKLDIMQLIGNYCSSEEVKQGKPAPDVYLLAAKKLGVEPSECLVLEDASKGVEAAKAAGMTCFAVTSQYTKGQDFSLADKILNNLSEVFQLIK